MSDAATFRQAQRRDIPRLAELWAHAFPGERSVEDRVRQLEAGGVYGGVDQAWYTELDGRLAGAFRGYRLTQYLHGTPLPMLGVAAVAVGAHARRRGLGAAICRHAIAIGRERGDLVSVLYPFRPDFYYRLGWGMVGVLDHHRFHTASLPVTVERPEVRLAAAGDLPAVRACYERVARTSHGLVQRTERTWNNHLTPPQRHVFVLGDAAGVRGYLLLTYGRSPTAQERPLVIHELVAESGGAYEALLSWISLQRDEWPIATYDALPEERFDLRLQEPRAPRFRAARTLWAPTARRIRGPMLRVLDVARALQAPRAWPQAEPCRFTLRVTDAEVPENEGPWQVTQEGGVVACERTSKAPELELGAAEFAQLYVGEISVRDALALGRATCRVDSQPIDALFRSERTLRVLDEF
jgi:predicted acetyltransferase